MKSWVLSRPFLVSLIFALFFLVTPVRKAHAEVCSPSITPGTVMTKGQNLVISFDLSGDSSNLRVCPQAQELFCYQIWGCNTDYGGYGGCRSASTNPLPNQSISGSNIVASYNPEVSQSFWLQKYDPSLWKPAGADSGLRRVCSREWTVTVNEPASSCGSGTFQTVKTSDGSTQYTYNDDLTLKIDGSKTSGFKGNGKFKVIRSTADGANRTVLGQVFVDGQGQFISTSFDMGRLGKGNYKIEIADYLSEQGNYCATPFTFFVPEVPGESPKPSGGTTPPFILCDQANAADKATCNKCHDEQGVWTAVGCIPTSAQGIVESLVRIGLGLSGGVVVLMVLAGAFTLATSAGNPKQVEEAQQMISAAVIGLLFVIFSVIILRFIGISVLHIPGLGT